MMKNATRAGLILFTVSLAGPLAAADDPMEKAIKARQAEMQLRSFNAGPLFGMAKGDITYDAELANMLAGNLELMLALQNGRAWAKGSDNEAYPGKTTALPTIWTTYPEISEYGKKYVTAVNELAAVAGNGQDALKSKIGAVGKACKACHDEFREKK
jgi:cytochrome c556